MMQALLFFWLICSILLAWERRIVRLIIYLAVFSSLSSICFLLFAAPDIALAEVVVSVFSTVIFITSFEKYYSFADQTFIEKDKKPIKNKESVKRYIFPIIFSICLFALFMRFIPNKEINPFLKEQFISKFQNDVGGINAVTAIYLGYRLYDTLFEALMLIISVIAIIHLSWHDGAHGENSIYNNVRHSQIAVFTIRIICPIMILFSVYLITHGHLSPGGGFQGGVIVAAFFICRYMIYGISDVPINRVIKLEKIFFAMIVFAALFFIALLANEALPNYKTVYLIGMNLLIGMKVACGFFIMFYRFISFEHR